MSKIPAVSGFPEWLPAERLVEQHVIDVFREQAELHGFMGIETRAVEPLSQLLRKGEIDKEVYVLRRLHSEEAESSTDPDRVLGLHFDLTVPLARYVLEHQNDLAFPLRRYQVQKVWRGERPQEGRFREFYQADLDIIGQDSLPAHLDADVAVVMAQILHRLPIGAVTMRANNRKLAQGFFATHGIDNVDPVLRCVDKLPKIGEDEVAAQLRATAGLTDAQIQACLRFAAIRSADDSFAAEVTNLAGPDGSFAARELMEEGISELSALLSSVHASVPGVMCADLSIARGLDYYTGTVIETFLDEHPQLGSICSGGRYEKLAADNRHTYPGMGLSIGLSRLVSRMLAEPMVTVSRPVPTCVLVAVSDEAQREASSAIARQLRERGIACEVAPTAAKFGKQIRYADRRQIPYVWFPGAHPEGGAAETAPGAEGAQAPRDQVKDIRSGEQWNVDAATWEPPAEDKYVQVMPVDSLRHS